MNEKSWFAQGLRFKCTQCGKCCTGSPGYTWVTEEEILAIAAHLQLSVDECVKRYIRLVNGRYALKEHAQTYNCVFLKEKKCSIYQVRPKQCRTFPWWVENLKSKEQWQKAAERCEGINHPEAELTTAGQINAICYADSGNLES